MGQIRITGSNGFVGENLRPYLVELGFETSPISRDQFVNFNSEVLEQCDAVVHLAGKVHDLKGESCKAEFYEVNYELTKKLYDGFLQSNAKKFIFVSSVKAVADVCPGILMEDHLPAPNTDYGKSKLMAERYIEAQILPAGKSYYILRPCMIHGPGNKGNLNLFYKFVQKGIPYPLAAFQNRRSFLSVENLCFVISEFLSGKDVPSGVYNIADDEALSTNEVFSILASTLNNKPKLWHVPKVFVNLLSGIIGIFGMKLTKERLEKLTEDYLVSNDKIKHMLDVKLPVNSREGLIHTAKSFK